MQALYKPLMGYSVIFEQIPPVIYTNLVCPDPIESGMVKRLIFNSMHEPLRLFAGTGTKFRDWHAIDSWRRPEGFDHLSNGLFSNVCLS